MSARGRGQPRAHLQSRSNREQSVLSFYHYPTTPRCQLLHFRRSRRARFSTTLSISRDPSQVCPRPPLPPHGQLQLLSSPNWISRRPPPAKSAINPSFCPLLPFSPEFQRPSISFRPLELAALDQGRDLVLSRSAAVFVWVERSKKLGPDIRVAAIDGTFFNRSLGNFERALVRRSALSGVRSFTLRAWAAILFFHPRIFFFSTEFSRSDTSDPIQVPGESQKDPTRDATAASIQTSGGKRRKPSGPEGRKHETRPSSEHGHP